MLQVHGLRLVKMNFDNRLLVVCFISSNIKGIFLVPGQNMRVWYFLCFDDRVENALVLVLSVEGNICVNLYLHCGHLWRDHYCILHWYLMSSRYSLQLLLHLIILLSGFRQTTQVLCVSLFNELQLLIRLFLRLLLHLQLLLLLHLRLLHG